MAVRLDVGESLSSSTVTDRSRQTLVECTIEPCTNSVLSVLTLGGVAIGNTTGIWLPVVGVLASTTTRHNCRSVADMAGRGAASMSWWPDRS
jgi:hypothetical protein